MWVPLGVQLVRGEPGGRVAALLELMRLRELQQPQQGLQLPVVHCADLQRQKQVFVKSCTRTAVPTHPSNRVLYLRHDGEVVVVHQDEVGGAPVVVRHPGRPRDRGRLVP